MADRKVLLVVVPALFVAAIVIAFGEWSGTVATPAAPAVAESGAADPAPAVVHERAEQAPAAPVAVAPTAALRVRAVDGVGRPVADARMRLTMLVRAPDGAERPISSALPAADAEGIAMLPSPMQLVSAQQELVRATVCAVLVGADGPEVIVDARSPPASPVDILVPPFGQMEVALFGAEGEPWALPANSGVLSWVTTSGSQRGSSATFDSGGCATVPRVRCGAPLAVRGPGQWSEEREVVGPARAGDTVRVELRLPAAAVVLVGRMLRSDHRPFHGHVGVWIGGLGGGFVEPSLPVAEDGRFALVLSPHMHGEREIHCRVRDAEFRAAAEEADIAPRLHLRPGDNQVGDVVLAVPPLLVGGRVQRKSEAAAGDVKLHLERQQRGEMTSWMPAPELPLHVDGEGRFAVHAFARGCRHRLQLRAPGRPQTVEFAPGTSDLVVTIADAGSVTATFLTDPLIELLEVKLVPPSVPRHGDFNFLSRFRGKPQPLGDRVRFLWTGLDPGSYRFMVCSGTRTLVQFAIDVGEDEVRDPRLLDIDLRNHLGSLRVQVTDLAGERLPVPARLFVQGSSDPGDWSAQLLWPDRSSIVTFAVAQPAELFVLAHGWRGRRFSDVVGDVKVALMPAAKFTLRCAQLVPLSGVNARLTWMLATPLEPVAAGTKTSGLRFVSSVERNLLGDLPQALTSGTASGMFGCALPLALHVHVGRPGGSLALVAVDPAVIDGDQLVDGQKIELTLDSAALRQVLEGR